MNEERIALNRRRFFECLSAMGLGCTLMPDALVIAAQDAETVTVEMIEVAQKIAGVSFTREEQQSIVARLNASRGYLAGFRFSADRQSWQQHAAGDRVQSRSAWQGAADGAAVPESSRAGGDEALDRRGACVSPGDAPGEAGGDAPGETVRADGAVSLAIDQVRSHAPLRRDPHAGAGASAGEAGRRRDCRRPVSGSSARHALRAEGPVRGPRHEDDVGRLSLQGSGHRHRRHGVHEAARGGRDPRRETIVRGAGADGAVVRRRHAEPLEHRSRTRRALLPVPGSATAAGLVAFSIGSDTGGSIIQPSTRNGITGMRPTFGRVSRYGAMALAWTQDTVGPMCRSAEDCALVFNAIYGPDGKDNTVLDVPFGWDATADVTKLRVGYLRSAFSDSPAGQPGLSASVQHATRRNNEEALRVIRSLGVEVVPFDLPDVAIEAIDFIRYAETAAAFDDVTRSGRLREIEHGPEQSPRPAEIRPARFIPAVEYIQANRYRLRVMEQVDAAMSGLDLFIGTNLLLTNRTGHPVISLPNGFFEGSPTGLQLTGKLFGEPELLLLAHAFQSRTDHHLKRPPISSEPRVIAEETMVS